MASEDFPVMVGVLLPFVSASPKGKDLPAGATLVAWSPVAVDAIARMLAAGRLVGLSIQATDLVGHAG